MKSSITKIAALLFVITLCISSTLVAQVTAVDDEVWVEPDTTTIIVQYNNDFPSVSPLCITHIAGPFNGIASVNTSGSWDRTNYTPNMGYMGLDSIQYVAYQCGTTAPTDTAWILIHVVKCDITVSLPKDTLLLIGDTMVFTTIVTSSYPIVSWTWSNNTGLVDSSLLSPQFVAHNHTSSYLITVRDSAGCIASDHIIPHTAFSDTMIAKDDQHTVYMNSSNIFYVSGNDVVGLGVTGKGETISILNGPFNGTTIIQAAPSILAGETILYDPNMGFSGNDSIEYIGCNQWGNCDTAMVRIVVLPYASCGDSNVIANATKLDTDTFEVDLILGDSVLLVATAYPTQIPMGFQLWGKFPGYSLSDFTCVNSVCDSVWFKPAASGLYATISYDHLNCTDTTFIVVNVDPCNGSTVAIDDTANTVIGGGVVIPAMFNDILNGPPTLTLVPPTPGVTMVNIDTHITYQYTIPGIDTICYILTDAYGCADTGKIFVYIDSIDQCADCVWPGDANDDNVANNFDLLSIGLGFGQSDIYRFDQTITWFEHGAYDWFNSSPLGVNYKHADTDGNGTIDFTDTAAILMNYGLTHAKGAGAQGGPNDPTLGFAPTVDTSNTATIVDIPIVFGTNAIPANNIYGLAFTINYDSTVVDTNSAQLLANNSWLGLPNDIITLQKDFHSEGKIEVAISRIDQMNMSGQGRIGTLRIATVENLIGKTATELVKELQLSFSNVRVIDNQENNIVVNTKSDTLFVVGLDNHFDFGSNINIYPNPAQNQITLTIESASIDNIQILSMEGKLINEFVDVTDELVINTTSYANGVYFARFSSDKGIETRKIIIAK